MGSAEPERLAIGRQQRPQADILRRLFGTAVAVQAHNAVALLYIKSDGVDQEMNHGD